jgi:hypothetical protein
MYINLDTTDSEYQYLYQYQNVAGVDEWSPLFRMFTNTYRKNIPTGTAVFVDGQTDLFIRILDILPADIAETSSPEDFNIQYSILGDHPIISSIVVAGEYSVIASEKHLKISVNAAEKQNGNFVDLQGGRVIHLFITVV